MSGALGPLDTALVAQLREADARIDAHCPARHGLSPTRGRARTLVELTELLSVEDDAALVAAFAEGMRALALAQLESFPENLFWDLDFIAAEVLRQGRREGAVHAAELLARMAELQRLYGRDTVIAFRYVHDFSYGYDWAKWVAREPDQDGSVGPFDLEFLVYMQRRAHELVELIAADDAKYPQLRDAAARNPFPFSREPDDELRLMQSLARRGEIPVEVWRADAKPDWRRDWAGLRVAEAERLGLAIEPAN